MADIPKIRFKGFTEPWEQRKLGEVLKERTERAKGDEELLSVTIANGVIRQIDSEKRNTASEDRSNYKIVKKGDVPYNSMRMWQGAVGNSKYNGIVSPAYTILTPTSEANGKFFMELFKKKSTLQIFQRWSQGLTSDTWNLKYPILSSIQFAIPSVEEQEKIAEYFSSLDYLITLHQRKCDDTKELKKYMLQKMFPKNGEKFPEIRFKGFTEAWEQRKVSETAEIVAGGTPSTSVSEYWEPKEVPWLSSGEVHKKYVTYTDDMISKLGLSNSSAKMIKENSILIALAGQGKTRGTVAINRISLSTNQSIAAMTFNDDIIPEFVFSNLENRYDEIRAMSSGDGSRGGLNKQLVGNIVIPYTIIEEQRKIGAYFENLDNLITLHQRKCDTLKELKKYMLQNMFPKKG